MKYALYGLIFIVLCNLSLFMFQESLYDTAAANGVDPITIYQFGGSLLSTVNVGNASIRQYALTTEIELPASAGAIDEDNGNFFVDAITSTKNFFGDVLNLALTPLKWAEALLTSVPNTFKILGTYGVPSFIVFGLSGIWYILMAFIVGMLVLGR